MKKTILASLFTVILIFYSQAQQPEKLSTSQIYEALQKLNFLGSVLYVAAHPESTPVTGPSSSGCLVVQILKSQLSIQLAI